MSALKPLSEDSEAGASMVAACLPRGPIWHARNGDIAGMTAGLGDEVVRFHNRMVDLMSEANPATAEELIDGWEDVYGLPICADAPTDMASRQAAVAGAHAAQGGADAGYFEDMVRAVLGDPAAVVTIIDRPWGGYFRAWLSHAWESYGSPSLAHYWVVEIPAATTDDQVHIIGCLLERYKPAHTVVWIRKNSCSGTASTLTISGSPEYDFGSHAVGSRTEHTFTVTNSGLGTARDINVFALPSGFRFKGGSFPGVGGTLGRKLAPLAFGTVVVEFVPTVVGAAGANLSFEYCNGSGRTYVSRPMVGTGT